MEVQTPAPGDSDQRPEPSMFGALDVRSLTGREVCFSGGVGGASVVPTVLNKTLMSEEPIPNS